MRLRGSCYCGDEGKHARMSICRCFWLTVLLHQRALRVPSRHRRCLGRNRPIRGKIYAIFLKEGAQHRTSVDGGKKRMRRPTIVHNYGCYYYRVTTVVTTVATENHMTTYVIFPHLRMPDVGHRFFKKNRIYFAHRVMYKNGKVDSLWT